MILRNMSLAEVEMVLDWAAAEGWNPGLDDAEAFHAADPGGFFLAEVGGVPAAAVSVVNHDDRNAFLGLYICRPGFRGQGIGFALWQHALRHAGDRAIGLDGVEAQQANYMRSGFVRHGATLRFGGQLRPGDTTGIVEVQPGDIDPLITLDAKAGGLRRAAFLRRWLAPSATRRTVRMQDGTGFATVRQCREGLKIGPIVAESSAEALRLASAAADIFPGSPVLIDICDSNIGLRDLLRERGFAPVFATARMYRGTAPKGTAHMQAIASMELG
ncbi:GNAT family N-acetyltransferase [Falsirhodobacter algicola]|uniref:GNAT family N-acetyltransferase n=1 Tax=Falsirhodobacter algicola TaxID=2692330 RepID=A0A8J8MRX9_9RHOB|nr:GNAT family N-acetyltransferase [Falsirhodobacter algicola]QUS35314.1 GNAT family N-acetyltransferase [Falsirhodobacter algicola]